MPNTIYLDHNATTPMLAEVATAMAECQTAGHGNPESQHAAGRRARQVLDGARETIGRLVGARLTGRQPDRVIFTSGGTEANNLAVLGIGEVQGPESKVQSREAGGVRTAGRVDDCGVIIISAIEHPSVMGPAEHLERLGWRLHRLGVSSDGVIDLDELRTLLPPLPTMEAGRETGPVRLVSLMLANNETGVIQPVAEASVICQAAGVPLHTDAVQMVGKQPVDFQALGASAMSISAHKLHGPVGIGALIVRHGVPVVPRLFGGFQQESLRPGTESVALAVGFCKALELWHDEAESRERRLRELRTRLETRLQAGFPGLVVNGGTADRLPHTANLAFRGLDRQALLIALDLAGVACSSGSACASGSSEPSHVLRAMGLQADIVASSLRFSLGSTTTEQDIDEAASRILRVCGDLRRTPKFETQSSKSPKNGR